MSSQDAYFKQIQRLISNFKKDSESRYSLAYFQTRQEKLKAIWATCEGQHEAQCSQLKLDVEKLDHYTKEFEGAEELVMDYLTLFQTKINQYTSGHTVQTQSDAIKLERIKIPSFTGSYADWYAFRDLFKCMIHNSTQLSNVQKLQYLRSALRGEAEQLVNHLTITDANYEPAWKLLCERYDNHRAIAQDMMQRFFNIENCTRNDPTALRHMLDTMNQILAGLSTLKTDAFSLTTIFLLNQKLDEESKREWQKTIADSTEIPSLDQFLEFLKQRFSMLEALSSGKPKVKIIKANTTNIGSKLTCPMCKGGHKLYECSSFKQASIQTRRDIVRKAELCFNCLQTQHRANKCPSKHGCKICGKKHNTLLHPEGIDTSNQSKSISSAPVQGHSAYTGKDYVLLATALIKVSSQDGEIITFRALLDSGAQRSFISESAVQLLQTKRKGSRVKVSGIGAVENVTSRGETKICAIVQTEHGTQEKLMFTPLILTTITAPLPCTRIPFNIPVGLTLQDLADPSYYQPGNIDILIGADLYGRLLLPGLLPGQPCAQRTKLGWVLFGSVPCKTTKALCALVSYTKLEEVLRKFWETEELPAIQHLTSEEKENEDLYKQSVMRQPNGTYSVGLPFKGEVDPFNDIGDTRDNAFKRFRQLEHRFKSNPTLHEQYRKFMQEYIDLGHMSRVPAERVKMTTAYYLPHHAVIRETSSTTKLRVVFNASQKGSKGKSLNELLHTGHTIQGNLLHLLMRWRQHRYVFAADIEKMYRQISVHEKDRHFQRILWRPIPNGPIQHFQLNTVTYGTACAPYLAIRTLHQLAADESSTFPEAAQTLTRDFYVDDVLTGSDNIESLLQLQIDLRRLLSKGGFHLRKWSSNHTRVLERVSESERETQLPLHIAVTENVKTLGIQWHPAADEFSFTITKPDCEAKFSKRNILAEVSKLFDPIGWLQPCIIIGKVTLRQLWEDDKGWDDDVEPSTVKEWVKLRSQLPELGKLRITRWIQFTPSHQFELHGFCDSSKTAYAAVVYIRVTSPTTTKVTLITAKSKVTPVKVESVSRLELNGAVLLVKLMDEVIKAHKWASVPRHYWTDSTTVLAWIQKPAAKWETYIANRVSIIQQHSSVELWHHVRTTDNPADIASRGMYPKEFLTSKLWWNGPEWLTARVIRIPQSILQPTTEGEKKIISLTVNVGEPPEILGRYSSFYRLKRIMAWCQRFTFNARRPATKRKGNLTEVELREASNTCIRISQHHSYSEEIQELSKGNSVHRTSHLKTLAPKLDHDGILRVGGRIQHALIAEAAKHPAIIPKGPLAKLLIKKVHHLTLHGGCQLTLATFRLSYWIISGQTAVKQVLRECMTCFRMTAKPNTQLMGNLPAVRVQLEKPFLNTGIDYAGPIIIKWNGGRGAKTTKAYIAVFVCMATKAFHLELVSDLTTNACIAALRRFIARRGKCQSIYSDCGSNFLGANKQLQAIYRASMQACSAEVANQGIQWKFIPPSSPHFGGLWEAGVKSMKAHLYKTIGKQILNVEEMNTLLAQIEACMNSRPLTQISEDPNDLAALTPGHFLTGTNLFEIKSDPSELSCTLLKRWHLVQQMKQSFWRRWSEGYLQRLQQRSKWIQRQDNFKVGELVLVKIDHSPSMQWPLARILATHPGPDGLVRTVTVNLRGNITKRPIVKICKLPFNEEHQPPPENPPLTTKNDVTTHKAIKRQTDSNITFLKKRRVNRTLVNIPTILLTILMVFGVFPPPALSGANVSALNSGLYMEQVGTANLIRGSLRINIEIPTSDLDKDEANIQKINSSITSMCNIGRQTSKTLHCEDLVNHISEFSEETVHQINLLRFMRVRNKRGIFGQMLTALFGVNDEIITDVETLFSNQDSLKNMLGHQSKIILQATKKLNTTLSKINKQLERFSTQLAKGLQQINEAKSWYATTDANQVNIQFLATYQRAINYIQEVHSKYNHIWDAFHTKEGILECIKLADLQKTIKTTQELLPAHLVILHSTTSKMIVRAHASTLSIHGFLRIIDHRRFDLIKATAIPHQLEPDVFSAFSVTNSILGINYHDQLYFETTRTDLTEAPELTSGTYLLTTATLTDMRTKPNCVVKELYNLHNQATCPEATFRISKPIWQQMMSPNSWLFITPRPIHAQSVCQGIRSDFLINGTGIVKITQDCQFQAEEFILVGDRSFPGKPFPVYISPNVPKLNLSLHHPEVKLLNISQVVLPSESFMSLLNEQEELTEQINGMQLKTMRPHATISTISICLSCLICAGLTITAIYWLWRTKYATNIKRNISPKPSSTTWYDEHRL